jgi:hypothetical protein
MYLHINIYYNQTFRESLSTFQKGRQLQTTKPKMAQLIQRLLKAVVMDGWELEEDMLNNSRNEHNETGGENDKENTTNKPTKGEGVEDIRNTQDLPLSQVQTATD